VRERGLLAHRAGRGRYGRAEPLTGSPLPEQQGAGADCLEKRTTGFVQITVINGGRHHSTTIPATGPETFLWVMAQVDTARSMSV
jgi:hypothetical protein